MKCFGLILPVFYLKYKIFNGTRFEKERGTVRYLFMLLLSVNLAVAQNPQFNADSAYAIIEHLTVTIGPRPMGSANERAALRWTVAKFHQYGADTAYVMPVLEANGTVNTNSGVAIGIFRGATDSTIVIGGHIDSSGPEIPGANDDASGTACMIELARVWSQRPRHFTLLFAVFCGEESGLVGSEYFVDHYADLNHVKLMLQIDMAGSSEALIPFIDVYTHQAPQWLVEDAFTIDRALGYNSLVYPTHFFTINTAQKGGGAGSDHEPFLNKNIPAIDFTAGVNTSPIHTAQDKIEFIEKPMLTRSGLLVDGLLNKYQQQGIPAPTKGNYMLWQILGARFYLPQWSLQAVNILALLLGGWAFYRSRQERLQIEKDQRIKFSGLKFFLSMIIIGIFLQLGEAALQLFKGLRFPWMVPLNHYLWYSAIWTLAGVWAVSYLMRNWKFSPDPYVYSKRALIFLFVQVGLFMLASSRLAFYPALSLLALSVSILLPTARLKMVLLALSALPMLRLMFFEMFPLGARSLSLAAQGLNTFIESFLYSAILTVLIIFWYLPTIYHFGYVLSSSPNLVGVFKYFRRPLVGLALLFAIVGYGGYLYSSPAYNQAWRARLEASAEYELPNAKSKLLLRGNEFMRNVEVVADTLKRHFDDEIVEVEIPMNFQAAWFKLSGSDSVQQGSQDTVMINWQLISSRPWFQTSLTVEVDTLSIEQVSSPLQYKLNGSKLTFSWYCEPAETLNVKASFTISSGAKIRRIVKAIYPETPFPLHVTAELADVVYQTTVTYRDTVRFSTTPLNRL